MSDTLTLNKLEKLIEVETKLRDEYEQQLDQKDAAIARALALEGGPLL